ncbi:CHAT domain-containing protein [Kitasatospora sp. NPDC004531]
MTPDEALALISAHLDPAIEDPAELAWFDTAEAAGATSVLRAGGVPPGTELPLEHAFLLGYGDLFAFAAGDARDLGLLGEGLLCLLVVRRHLPERVSPELAPVLAVAAGEDDGHTPEVGRAHFAGMALMVAFQRWRHPGTPALAVRLLRRAAADCPPDTPLHGTVLSALSVAQLNDWLDRGDPAPLAEAVRTGRAAVAAVPDTAVEQARRHGNLGTALRFWSDAAIAEGAVREAAAEIRTALRLCPPDDPQQSWLRLELGLALAQAAVLFGDRTGLPEAVELLREALRAVEPAAAQEPTERAACAERMCHLGMALIAQGTADSLAEGIALCRRAATDAPTPGARLQYLHNLGLALLGSTTDPAELAIALAAAREAAELAPPDSPMFAETRVILSRALALRHLAHRRPEDLAEAVALATEAYRATPPELPARRLERGAALAELLALRAEADGDDPSAEPVALLRRVVAENPDRTAERARALRHLADALLDSPLPGDRDEALELYRECLELPSPEGDFEAEVSFVLGLSLADRAAPEDADSWDEDTWQRGVALMTHALALLPAGSPLRPGLAARLAIHRVRRSEHTGDPDDRREGIRLLTAAVATDGQCAPADRVRHRTLLGAAVLGLADQGGELAPTVTGPLQEALDLAAADDPQRILASTLLGNALATVAWSHSDAAALDRAYRLLAEAVAVPGGEVDHRAECLSVLGRVLRLRFHLHGDPALLEQAVERYRESLALTEPQVDPTALGGLAACLANLYGHRPDQGLRVEAMARCRAALAGLPEHHAERASLLADLGYLEWSVAAESGSPEELDAALATLRSAVAAAPDRHDDRGLALTNLGVALLDRANRTGDRSWEIQAVQVFGTALEHTGPGSAQRPLVLNNLAMAQFDLSVTTGDAALRERAFALLAEAAADGPGMSPARERAALNLALLRYQQARATGDLADAVEAYRRFEDLVGQFDPSNPLRPLALARFADIGVGLAELLEQRPALRVWRQAAAAAREALGAQPGSTDPVCALARRALVTVQVRRAAHGDQVDLAEATRLIRQTAEDPAFPPHVRLQAARLWGALAARTGRFAEALAGFSHAVALLPVVAPRQLARLDQEDRLSSGRGLASAAAALAIRAGDPARALALLEQGRGVLLAQGLDNQGDLSRLRELDPARAAEFEQIRDRLSQEHPLASLSAADAFFLQGAGDPTAAALRDAEERHALSRRWDQLLDEIRTLPDLDDFLRPPTTRQLLSAADRGPVVVVNVSEFGSDALILAAAPGREPRLDVVPLPDLTPEDVAAAAQSFTEQWVDVAYGDEGPARAAELRALHRGLLDWLWDALAAPVLNRLGLRGTPLDGEEWPRLWWCPTGRLAFLPLHAVGKGRNIPGTWVMDRVVSSYTPTVRSLLRARRRTAAAARRRPAPLVVSLAHTPGGPPLPGAEPEAALVSELFPDGLRLDGPQATVEQVRRELYRHPWVHFSCHGLTDPDSPSNSGLILHDGRLTALDISARRPVDAELAFLSACSTSQVGSDLPDEAVHLAPSFQLAGFTHVIGTLWSVSDRVAQHVTGEFYADLRADAERGRPFDPALALHRTVRELRQRLLPAPHLWAGHVHIGP